MSPGKRRRLKPSERAKQAAESAKIPKGVAPRNPRRNHWQPSARDLEIYNSYCEGQHTMRKLAEKYKLSLSSISEICTKVENYLAAIYIHDIRELRVRSTHRLEMLFSHACQSYLKSLEDEVTVTVTKAEDGKEERREQRRGQAGSAAHLDEARKCISDMLDIWGGKAPKVVREIHQAMRVGGRSPEQALEARLSHLQSLVKGIVHDN